MKKLLRVSLPFVVIIFGFGVVKVLKASKPAPQKNEIIERPLALHVSPVRRQSIALSLQSEGEVRAIKDIDIVAQVSGRIVSLNPSFIDGGQVDAGVPLVEIDDTDYQLAVIKATAEVAEAELKVQQSIADADVARKQLVGDGHTPLALKLPHIAQAKAKLASAKAELKQAQVNLSRTQISLPFNSRIRNRSVGEGEFVSVATTLGRAFATESVEVVVAFNDSQLAALDVPIGYNAQQDLSETPAVTLSAVVAEKKRYWQGRLVRLDAAIDPKTQLLYGYVEVDAPYAQETIAESGMPLAVGLYVSAEIEGRTLNNAFVVPAEAIRSGNKVYLIEDGRLQIREVDIIHQNRELAVLQAGVAVGEQVVVSPVKTAVEGMSATPIFIDGNGDSAIEVAMKVEDL